MCCESRAQDSIRACLASAHISQFRPSATQLVIPPWPFYNQHKTQWLRNRPESSSEEAAEADATGDAAVIDAGTESSKKK
jgi:hypothetical protein